MPCHGAPSPSFATIPLQVLWRRLIVIMTFDEGNGSELSSWNEDFRAKVNALLQDAGVGFGEVCARTGIEPTKLRTAIEEGTYGFQKNSIILHQFMTFFGLGADWLLSGPSLVHPANSDEQRLSLRKLAWEFILSDDKFPWSHRQPFLEHVMGLARSQRPGSTMAIAARTGLPRTITDMGHVYHRLLKSGYFEHP